MARLIHVYEAIADRTGLDYENLPNHVCVVGLAGTLISPEPIGVIHRKLEKYFTPDRKVWRASNTRFTNKTRLGIAGYAESQVGKMYDFGGVLRFVAEPFVRWTGCLLPNWFPRPNPNKPFCSELAAEAYRLNGYVFKCTKGQHGCEACTPADLLAECLCKKTWEVERIWPA